MPEADSDRPSTDDVEPKRRGKLGLIVTLTISLAFGGGGFFATKSEMLSVFLSDGLTASDEKMGLASEDFGSLSFLELDPLSISVGSSSATKELRLRAFLQTRTADPKIAALQPQILDIFATYLRAVPINELGDPTALLKLRVQLLRRVRLLVGSDAITDLLIVDFVVT